MRAFAALCCLLALHARLALSACTPGAGTRLHGTQYDCVSDAPALSSMGARFLYSFEEERPLASPAKTAAVRVSVALTVPPTARWLAVGFPDVPGKSACGCMRCALRDE